MADLFHKSPSVGSVIKKLLAINPDLDTSQLIDMVRRSTYKLGGDNNEFANSELINEEQVLSLARATLRRENNANL
ncbi:MAG TPA: hypothetical protein DCS07_08520 [Bdellovibrionales bacterium]|nr:MAG: hypothetical protein A2Z97_02915 [Bdellovibrionales bacterium GWB1_52_6]OFZ03459.1 MAG: hypothetical protein A2X97_05790 [Bdellovibrionales bacterium GWA1_52_35]OFZ37134.1 MAG: hypothetical protein A2070_01470 [Bdellovibrionales bacterium GWC1_52_8]HAR42655.1 hypothetical protein [Bdellovibrionales bacterium]HCM41041.1 hypothetical protein [Bdellovibrionales bacterium]